MAEDDGDVLDSWEDAEETNTFERRMEEKLMKEQLNEEEDPNVQNSDLIIKPQNVGRTDYTPQIKILQRSSTACEAPTTNQKKTEAELKQTLKLREAEYQAARSRILGSNYDENLSKVEEETNDVNKKSIMKKRSPQADSGEKEVNKNSIIRQPNGPDDSRGFNVSR